VRRANRGRHARQQYPGGVLVAGALGDHGGKGILDPGGGVEKCVAKRGTGREEPQHVLMLAGRAATAAATRASRSAVTAATIACSRLEK